MKTLLSLVYYSVMNRKLTAALTMLSIALNVALLVGVENVRVGARDSFANTISQTDLIVGARGSSLQLLLYAVFHIGTAANDISYETYEKFKNHPAVAWTIPLSFGDSHRGIEWWAPQRTFIRGTDTGETGKFSSPSDGCRTEFSILRWAQRSRAFSTTKSAMSSSSLMELRRVVVSFNMKTPLCRGGDSWKNQYPD
jgi:hypothetical protein